MGNGERYYVENGKIFCNDGMFDEPYEVTCSVATFLEILKLEGYAYEA